MTGDAKSRPSFSPLRKWAIALNLLVRTAAVMAIVVMANYLSGRYINHRFYLSTQTRIELAPRTLSVLKHLTNKVEVTLYYDKEDPFFTTISTLLNEYCSANHRIHVTAVDYLRSPGKAIEIVSKYSQYNLAASTNKNLILFDCEGRVKIVYGNMLAQDTKELVPNSAALEFATRTTFYGEMAFTSALLIVSEPKPFQAYFLTGHGEHRPDDLDETSGYLKFASVLRQNYVEAHPLMLIGTNTVPTNCNLLIIAGPMTAIQDAEIEKIQQYLLQQGGRLLALMNPLARGHPTGLEKILASWGVDAGTNRVIDRAQSPSASGSEVVVSAFSRHPIVNPLLGSGIYLVAPYPVGRIEIRNAPADAPRVEVIAASTESASLAADSAGRHRQFPLAVAVENTVKGVITERGPTRIVAVGDSIFLSNGYIDYLANRDFAANAINWLLDRPFLVEGLGPRKIAEFRLVMTQSQQHTVQWILLVAMPGGVLLFGGLVWLRRRK